MPALTTAEVLAIARLARLELDEAEVARLADELGDILAHMDRLAEVDTDGVEPMTHAVPMRLGLRDDVVEPSLPVDEALGGAPDRADDCFRVPHIIKSAP
jgi:aspartyl-tRNA(Asn)/glutamyl-tRNA(Gln) amidotransferase subunit C